MSNGKIMITHLIARLMKMMLNEIPQYKNESIFPKPYEPFRGDNNFKVHLSNWATKTDNATEIDTSIHLN